MTKTTGKKGITLIKFYEGFRANAYYCPANVLTIGYGTTANVTKNMVVTEAQAERLLQSDLRKFETTVNSSVKVPLTQDQFDALVCFTYNVGSGAFKSSTLLKVLNQGRYDLVADQLMRWNKAGGKVLAGLTKRRASEASLFTTGKVNLK
jgi:lysozyme